MQLRKVTSLVYAGLMLCASTTCSIPNAEKIEFRVLSQFNTNDKIKDIKNIDKELTQIKTNEENERRVREEIKRQEQELRKQKKEFILTFYTSLNSENGYGSITCTGSKLNDGIVANNILKLGTKIQLDGYGEVVVADRGSQKYFNNENRLDVFVPKEDGESNYTYKKRVNNMGKVKVTGYILK